jgi:aryl-alcohol dehydrogenase-like predicted oxidoreductase
MQTRRFGRTGHMSTIVIFGAFAIGKLDQQQADATMELVLERGVNHIDVAPSYFDAETRLGPWLEEHRDRFFLGCKTQLRNREEAHAELHQSLERLCIDCVDARDEGLTQYIGITSHGLQAPAVQIEALQRFDFDSLLFTLNFTLWANDAYRRDAATLLEMAAERDVGTMVIKTWARGPWVDKEERYHTWYEPFDDPGMIERALRFNLSQPISGVISAGDARLLPMILEAAERFRPMDDAEQADLLATAARYEPLFT